MRGRRVLALSLLALAGCRRAGDALTLDVCALSRGAVAAMSDAAGRPTENAGAPIAGSCDYYRSDERGAEHLVLRVTVYTEGARRGMGPDLGRIGSLNLAEASQTWNAKPSTTELAGLARYHAVLHAPNFERVFLSESGVLLDIEGEHFADGKVSDLARVLWPQIMAYRPR